MIKCKLHPTYQALRQPELTYKHPKGCPRCWRIWNEKNPQQLKLYEPDDKMLEHLQTLTPDDIKRLMSESARSYKQRLDEERRKRNEPPRDDRTGVCVFCKGKVIARMTRGYHGDPRHMIIGPGSRNQMTTVHHGFHCTQCGLKYEFPPPGSLNSTDGSA